MIPVDHAASLQALFERHGDDVWRYLRRRTDHHSAEDLTMEVFVVAWRRRADVPVDALPWLYAVARRVLANHRRGNARTRALTAEVERAARTSGACHPDHAPLLHVHADLVSAMACLSPEERELVLLVAWEGLTTAQAAQVVGCRESAARVRLHRARKRLRVLLDAPPESDPEPALEASL